jgi:hydrogenase maturation protease
MNSTSAESRRILVAGVGNIFLGDDAFGVEVAQRLAQRHLPEGVRVVDFGIRGLDLAYSLLDGYSAVVIVDAAPRGGPPGTLYVLEPGLETTNSPEQDTPLMEAHNMDPARVLRLVAALGREVPRVLIVGCEPETSANEEDMPIEISAAVRSAVDEAVTLVESLVARLLVGGERTIPRKEGKTCHQ